jgi:hypothetical protein
MFITGVWISFPRHSPVWQVDQYFHSPKQKTTGQNIGKVSERGKKLARIASGFVFLLANPEFYSHLASWRVVIRTSVYFLTCAFKKMTYRLVVVKLSAFYLH